MNPTRGKPTPISILIYLLVGILAGVGSAAILTAIIMTNPLKSSLGISEPEKATFKNGSSEVVSTTFDQAERAIADQQPQLVKEILLPYLNTLSNWDELAQAYRLLGDAERMQYHFNLAAGYYESLYSYEPNLDNLFLLATTYDEGGDLNHAYQKYLLLTEADDTELQGQRIFIDERLEDITDVLSYRNKGVLPTPEPTYTPRPRP